MSPYLNPHHTATVNLCILLPQVLKGKRPTITKPCPDKLLDLMQRCWSHDPKGRPPFTEVVETLDEILRELA